MNRSAGVIGSAIVLFVLSLVSLLLAGSLLFLLGALSTMPPDRMKSAPMPVDSMTYVLYGVTAFFSLLAAWMVGTGIGLIRLRPWARISTIVVGALMAFLFGGLLATYLSVPSIGLPENERSAVAILIGLNTLFFVIGVWFLVYFNRRAARAAFAGSTAGPAGSHVSSTLSPRPTGITVIGWLLLLSALSIAAFLPFDSPTAFLGFVFRGRTAKVVLAGWAVLCGFGGYWLLKLKPRGHALAVASFSLSVVNWITFYAIPGVRSRAEKAEMEWLERVWPSFGQSAPGPGVGETGAVGLIFGIVVGLCVTILPLVYLLWRRKDYFAAVERARSGRGVPLDGYIR